MVSEQQLQAIEMYIKGSTVSEISKLIGVNRSTFYEWMKKDEFRSELDKFQREIKTKATNRIANKVDIYINELEKIALTSRSDKTRTDALTYLIDHVVGKSTTKVQDVTEVSDSKESSLSWEDSSKDSNEVLQLKKVQ